MNTHQFEQKLLSVQTNLLNFAYTLTLNRDDAEDLCQDTALKALDNEDKFVDGTNFKAWVFTIMRNIFINQYRRSTRAAVVVDKSEDLYQINVPVEGAESNPDDSYSIQEISEVVNHFPDEYRIPITMHLAGYHYAEIGKKLGVPVGTIKSRIFYARKKLQNMLEDFDYHPD
ncbi:MAG: RNA polymerase sigma factor [Pseudoflavonifractor sp.]|nr:RNA polymerase sigma factor [Alloprevotella sp.]MCM1116694.1 RNA polymerase sigma factor [Pseudoflavonifractor sp.]